MIKQVTTLKEFEQELINAGNKLVVVEFFVQWCAPCKRITPTLQEWSEKMDKVMFLKIDVDENMEVGQVHQVPAMPTFMFFKHGLKCRDDLVGASVDNLLEAIKDNLCICGCE